MTCPSCNSERIRRGGHTTWTIYVALIALAFVAVLLFHLNAALVAGVVLACVVLAHLLLGERVCVDCGHQWRGRASR
jgi:hypothetical protein